MSITIPNAISAQLEPFFLELGRAVYVCQNFESTLCTMHALLSYAENDGSEQAMMAAWDFHSSKTLGQLLTRLQLRVKLEPAAETALRYGVECRNKLIHGLLSADRVALLIEPLGPCEVAAQVSELKSGVLRANEASTALVDVLLEQHETSTSKLTRSIDALFVAKNYPISREH